MPLYSLIKFCLYQILNNFTKFSYEKQPPYLPVVRMKGEDGRFRGIVEINMNSIIKADAVGFGFILIKRKAVDKILEKTERSFNIKDGVGEDVSFCVNAKEAGFEIFVDTGLVCGHIGNTIIDERVLLRQNIAQKT